VPRLRAELESSVVGPRGDVTVVMRVFNDGRIASRVEGVDSSVAGLSRPAITTHLPLTLAAGRSIDVAMHWDSHTCGAVEIGEGGHFGIRARTGLPVAIERDYPVRISDTFVARLNPAPGPGANGNQFTSSGNVGGWVMGALRFACEYGR
jgi:hypothetical protein